MSKNSSNKNKKTKNDEKAAIVIGIILVCIVIAAIVAVVIFAVKDPDTAFTSNTSSVQSRTTQSAVKTDESVISKPIIELKENATYYADIDVKNHGKITVKLDQKAAPITVANFVNLANSGFYDGLTFHRIMAGFMMQGGDPTGTGSGGSSQKIKGEFQLNGVENNLSHTRGAISMARATPYDSASSQFFIVHQDSQFDLDGRYAAFGYVESGMDVVDAVCTQAKPTDDNGTIPPSAQPIINSIQIRVVE